MEGWVFPVRDAVRVEILGFRTVRIWDMCNDLSFEFSVKSNFRVVIDENYRNPQHEIAYHENICSRIKSSCHKVSSQDNL